MASLYGRLFTYRERPDRTPLEDFLTEALCDLLNRLPREVMREFVAKLFLPPDAGDAWREIVDNGGILLWKTQERIAAVGRLDLMLCCNEEPLIVVENKVGHSVTVEQLSGYGQWLGRQVAGQDWRGALVFLTHFTAPPDSFAKGDTNTYGVPWQPVCRWPDVWRWLNANASAQPETSWGAFAKELADFLGEQEMTSEMMTQHDLAALAVYVPSAARVHHLLHHIWTEAVKPSWDNDGLYGHSSLDAEHTTIGYYSDEAQISDFAYVRSPNAPYDWNVWFLTWGIAFPEQPVKWCRDAIPPLPKRPYAFFGFLSANDRQPIPSDSKQGCWGLNDGWSVSESEPNGLIKGRAMSDFDPDPDRLAEQITNWVSEAGHQLKLAIPAIVSAVPS